MKILPASVDKVVQDYTSQLNKINSKSTVGVYLTGSVALGDYHSNKSDIDFITVIKEEPTNDLLSLLKELHRKIEIKHNHPKLNGYYLTMTGIVNHALTFPSFFRNKLYSKRLFELRNFSLFELKFFSYCVYGQPVNELPINVQIEDVIQELYGNINGYWSKWVQNHSKIGLNRILLILFPRLSEWGMLGVARQLYTLNTGSVTSKLVAGQYCLDRLPKEFKGIMASAIDTRRLNKTELEPSLKRARETLDCMKWIISQFNATYHRR